MVTELAESVHVWRETAERVVELCGGLAADDWSRPTDLPGWSVHDVVAHLADIETQLAGMVQVRPGRPSVTGQVPPEWTGPGVEARRGTPSGMVLAELEDAVRGRAALLADALPDGPGTRPAWTPAGVDWDWATMLRMRVVDVWVHEQDIRRAVGIAGGLSSPGAGMVVDRFAATLPYVLGKKVSPPVGTEVAWEVVGEVAVDVRLVVGPDGRARPADGQRAPGCTLLHMDTETFTILGAGRRPVDGVPMRIDGDRGLGTRVATAMAVTP